MIKNLWFSNLFWEWTWVSTVSNNGLPAQSLSKTALGIHRVYIYICVCAYIKIQFLFSAAHTHTLVKNTPKSTYMFTIHSTILPLSTYHSKTSQTQLSINKIWYRRIVDLTCPRNIQQHIMIYYAKHKMDISQASSSTLSGQSFKARKG